MTSFENSNVLKLLIVQLDFADNGQAEIVYVFFKLHWKKNIGIDVRGFLLQIYMYKNQTIA